MKRGSSCITIRPAAIAVVAAVGLAAAASVVGCATGSTAHDSAATPAAGRAFVIPGPLYRYFGSMTSQYQGGGMMGGGPGGWMMSGGGNRWMTGAGGVRGWMHGGRLPGYMMGTSTDMGKIMGRFWAKAPGPMVSPAQADAFGNQTPAGAHVNRADRAITFTTTSVRLAAEASPPAGPDETFRIAGMVDPTVVVPVGARVIVKVINADPDTAHGMVITGTGGAESWMPMMTSPPAFEGSALWLLGNPTSAGMRVGTITFTAARPGTYRYLCAVPGHAREGMTGELIVTPGS